MTKLDSIFFDLDGTICDSYPGIENGIICALKKSGVDFIGPNVIKQMIGIPLNISLKTFVFKDDKEKILETIAYFRNYYSTKGYLESTLYDGIKEVVEDFSKYSKTYIVTAKPTEYARKMLEYHKINHFFNGILGFQDGKNFNKSELIRLMKPKKSSIMIGDKSQDILAGKNAEIMTAGVLYGYGSEIEIIEANPDFIVKSPQELMNVLQ